MKSYELGIGGRLGQTWAFRSDERDHSSVGNALVQRLEESHEQREKAPQPSLRDLRKKANKLAPDLNLDV